MGRSFIFALCYCFFQGEARLLSRSLLLSEGGYRQLNPGRDTSISFIIKSFSDFINPPRGHAWGYSRAMSVKSGHGRDNGRGGVFGGQQEIKKAATGTERSGRRVGDGVNPV